jgi:hypothetical protein
LATIATPLSPASQTHPLYVYWAPTWEKLAHVYEGSGGFLDGTYLVAHPREWADWQATTPVTPTRKLLARRRLARYENVAASIVEQKRAAIFRESVTRTVGPAEKSTAHPLETWWANVDGAGCAIDDWMTYAFLQAAIFGHAIHVMDRPEGASPTTRADERAPYLRLYSPLDMPDWITDDRDRLQAVRLMELDPRTSLTDALPSLMQTRTRILTETSWQVLKNGVAASAGEHGFGTLPVVIHYAARRALSSIVGRSVLVEPQLYLDLFNLTSEIRELLRNQTFGLLNAPLVAGDNNATSVEMAKSMIGTETGAENVVFSPLPLQYVQPDTQNVAVYQEEREALLRTIYRLTSIPWSTDSKAAEAAASLSLKREDMNQLLASYADECEKTEYQIAQLWFRATYGPEAWEAEWERAEVVIRYPDSFNITPFGDVLQQAQAAVSLEMPPSVMAELKKRLIAKFLPDAPPDVVDRLEADIDAAVAAAAKQQAQMDKAKLAALAAAPTTVVPRPPRVAA